MARLREHLFEPSSRFDVDRGPRRTLLTGLFQAGLHLVAFAALFVLAITAGVLEPEVGTAAGDLRFWVAVALGAGVGAGVVGLARLDPIDRWWRTLAGRLLTVVAVYAAYWLLLVAVGLDAIFAGLAFVVGRVVAVAWRYARTRR